MTTPYYQDDSVTLYHGTAEEILPGLSESRRHFHQPALQHPRQGPWGSVGHVLLSGWLAKVKAAGYADDMSEDAYAEWARRTSRPFCSRQRGRVDRSSQPQMPLARLTPPLRCRLRWVRT